MAIRALSPDDAVIVSIGRSAIGKARTGQLTDIRADELATQVFSKVLDRVPEISGADLEDLYLGCAEPSGEQGYNLARQIAILLGYDTLPGTTVNRFCASSLQAVRMAAHAIKSGEGQAFLVGGVETASRYGNISAAKNHRFGNAALRSEGLMEHGTEWSDPRDRGELPDAYIGMGQTAENVARMTGTSRQDQDAFAFRSQRAAAEAADTGFFDKEIVEVVLENGSRIVRDDSVRRDTTIDRLAELTPVFSPVGTVTAGNSCPVNDGASAAVIVSARFARERGLNPLARIVSTAVSGLSPEIMGLGPVESSRRALLRAGLSITDIDIVELNEAFSAQVLPSARKIGIDIESQLNPFGGSIALGHPFGATGVRLLATLVNGLQTRDQTLGLATLCVGGGQGMAMVIERLS